RRMNQRRLRVGDAADVDVVLAAFDHSKRLQLLGVHVLEVLLELLLRNRDGVIVRRLLENHRAAATFTAGASAATATGPAAPACRPPPTPPGAPAAAPTALPPPLTTRHRATQGDGRQSSHQPGPHNPSLLEEKRLPAVSRGR